MRFKGDLTQVLKSIQETHPMDRLYALKDIVLGVGFVAFAIEWYNSYLASQYYVELYCEGADLITTKLLLGSTCMYNAGTLLTDGVNSHSVDTGYWYGSTLNYFIRDMSSYWAPYFGGTYSVWHWIIGSSILLWIAFSIVQMLLNQEYILDGQDKMRQNQVWTFEDLHRMLRLQKGEPEFLEESERPETWKKNNGDMEEE